MQCPFGLGGIASTSGQYAKSTPDLTRPTFLDILKETRPRRGCDGRSSRAMMRQRFTLEYWRDGDWYVGRLVEVPGVFSQGATLEELDENIQEAYELMVAQDRPPAPPSALRRAVELEV
jgi:predicted RNase H-like HicB family nuclease